MTIDEQIAVMTAFRDGKAVEFRCTTTNNRWMTTDKPVWNFHEIEYRVKPEPPKPREFWLKGVPPGFIMARNNGGGIELRVKNKEDDLVEYARAGFVLFQEALPESPCPACSGTGRTMTKDGEWELCYLCNGGAK
jgi:hypothetical protein